MKKKLLVIGIGLAFILSSCGRSFVPNNQHSDNIDTSVEQQSFVSSFFKAIGKKATKLAIKNAFEKTVKTSMKKFSFRGSGGVVKNGDKQFRKYLDEADDLIAALEDPWWETAIGFIPVIGDAFDIYDLIKDAPKLARAIKRIESIANSAERRLNLINSRKHQWVAITGNLEQQLGYHAYKHGGGDIVRYMEQAERFKNKLYRAKKKDIVLKNGSKGIKYNVDGGFMITDEWGRIVTFGQ